MQIITCGLDRTLRVLNTVRDAQNREFSQGALRSKAKSWGVTEEELKLSPCLNFAAEPMKERQWDNVISCHVNDSRAYTWRYENRVKGKHVLQAKGSASPVKVCSVRQIGPSLGLLTIEYSVWR